MKPEPKAPPQEVLACLVERVTFHNEENGFCVLRTKARGHRDLVTVVGQAASISAGEWITASGEWMNDRAHAGGGVEALRATVAPGPTPVKSTAALRVAVPLLEEPVADRRNWTIPRLRAEIEAREGVRISRSQLSKALRKKSSVGGDRGTR